MKPSIALLFCAALAGCAHPVVNGRSTQSEVLATFGVPSEQSLLQDGRRVLMYTETPLGHGNVAYTIGTDGVVLAAEPLLNEEHFEEITQGLPQAEVRRRLGPPDEVQRHALLREDVWSWLYLDGGRRLFFNAHFDVASGALKSTSRTPAPAFISRR